MTPLPKRFQGYVEPPALRKPKAEGRRLPSAPLWTGLVVVLLLTDHEEVAVVLGQDPPVVGEGERRVGGADGGIEKEVIPQGAVRANGVEAAVLAVDEDVAVTVEPAAAGRKR